MSVLNTSNKTIDCNLKSKIDLDTQVRERQVRRGYDNIVIRIPFPHRKPSVINQPRIRRDEHE